MNLELDGKRALVTGGSRGIGRAIALKLADEGCDVAICARGADGLAGAVEELEARGAHATGEAVDVTDAQELDDFVNRIGDTFGGIDIVVANAGGLSGGPRMTSITADDWRFTLDINVTHPALVTQAAEPFLEQSGHGSVLFIASISGIHAWTRPHYGAAKAAEIHLVGSLARELAPKGIRVNAISPGSVMFPGSAWERLLQNDRQAFDRWLDHELPFGRLGRADEIADVASFLLSNRASWISGANVPVDGAQLPPNMLTTQPMPGAWGEPTRDDIS